MGQVTPKARNATRLQYAALPYKITPAGEVRILLITSRGTGRWVIPKGWPMKGRRPPKAAAQEAFEEAGLRGDIAGKPIGTYVYEKYLDDADRSVPCAVQVFPLRVKRQLKAWPEDRQRQTQWLAANEAAERVDEADLRVIILAFSAKLAARKKPEPGRLPTPEQEDVDHQGRQESADDPKALGASADRATEARRMRDRHPH